MDAHRFDRLARTWSAPATRRGIGRLLSAFPVTVAIAALLTAESEAANRRRNTAGQRRGERPDRLQTQGKKKKGKKCAKGGQRPNKKRKKCCAGLVREGSGVCAPPASGCTPATCASNSLCIGGICQPCDVCDSGCFFSTLQTAVNAAAPEETIHICAGIYAGDTVINQSVRLIGAGDGLGAGNTLLQGSGTDTVVTIEAENTVSLQSLRIAGGSTSFGGGIRNFGSLELTDCTITGNAATNFGGGINNSGTLKLTGCTVSGNTDTANQGGGIRNNGTMTLTGCTVSGNTALSGGGIYNFFGTGALINSTVSGNTAEFGGGIFINGGTVTLDAASRVTGNDADPTDPDSGGGIFNQGGTVPLSSADNVSGNTPDNCAPNGAVPLCQDPP